MNYRILIMFLILILSSVNMFGHTYTEYKSNVLNNSCHLRILIQVSYNTTKNDKEQLYLYDSQIKEALIRKDMFGNDVGIIPMLKNNLEEHGCKVDIDWQFDTARPLYWWTLEYSGGKQGADLISSYNIIIFLGHGDKHLIKFTIQDSYAKGKRASVDFIDVVRLNGRYHASSHMKNKGWIIFIACNVLDSKYNFLPLFTGVPIQYINIRDVKNGKPFDLSNTYLLAIAGFKNELIIGKREGIRGVYVFGILSIDYFIERLVKYLTEDTLNLRDAWFKAYKDYNIYLESAMGIDDIKFSTPTVVYLKIYMKDNNNYYIPMYNSMTNIYNIPSINPPSNFYPSIPKDQLVIYWIKESYEYAPLKGYCIGGLGHIHRYIFIM